MKTILNGEYKCYKRERDYDGGIKETELLFLHRDIPIELVEKVDKDRWAYISGAEDRSVDVTILGESFSARVIRPQMWWFYSRQLSYGVELSFLLSEYFGIKIFKRDRYNNNDIKDLRVVYKTSPHIEYCYCWKELEKAEVERTVLGKEQCPLNLTEMDDKWRNYWNESCFLCPFGGRLTAGKDG